LAPLLCMSVSNTKTVPPVDPGYGSLWKEVLRLQGKLDIEENLSCKLSPQQLQSAKKLFALFRYEAPTESQPARWLPAPPEGQSWPNPQWVSLGENLQFVLVVQWWFSIVHREFLALRSGAHSGPESKQEEEVPLEWRQNLNKACFPSETKREQDAVSRLTLKAQLNDKATLEERHLSAFRFFMFLKKALVPCCFSPQETDEKKTCRDVFAALHRIMAFSIRTLLRPMMCRVKGFKKPSRALDKKTHDFMSVVDEEIERCVLFLTRWPGCSTPSWSLFRVLVYRPGSDARDAQLWCYSTQSETDVSAVKPQQAPYHNHWACASSTCHYELFHTPTRNIGPLHVKLRLSSSSKRVEVVPDNGLLQRPVCDVCELSMTEVTSGRQRKYACPWALQGFRCICVEREQEKMFTMAELVEHVNEDACLAYCEHCKCLCCLGELRGMSFRNDPQSPEFRILSPHGLSCFPPSSDKEDDDDVFSKPPPAQQQVMYSWNDVALSDIHQDSDFLLRIQSPPRPEPRSLSCFECMRPSLVHVSSENMYSEDVTARLRQEWIKKLLEHGTTLGPQDPYVSCVLALFLLRRKCLLSTVSLPLPTKKSSMPRPVGRSGVLAWDHWIPDQKTHLRALVGPQAGLRLPKEPFKPDEPWRFVLTPWAGVEDKAMNSVLCRDLELHKLAAIPTSFSLSLFVHPVPFLLPHQTAKIGQAVFEYLEMLQRHDQAKRIQAQYLLDDDEEDDDDSKKTLTEQQLKVLTACSWAEQTFHNLVLQTHLLQLPHELCDTTEALKKLFDQEPQLKISINSADSLRLLKAQRSEAADIMKLVSHRTNHILGITDSKTPAPPKRRKRRAPAPATHNNGREKKAKKTLKKSKSASPPTTTTTTAADLTSEEDAAFESFPPESQPFVVDMPPVPLASLNDDDTGFGADFYPAVAPLLFMHN
jgi:hypothetical protein